MTFMKPPYVSGSNLARQRPNATTAVLCCFFCPVVVTQYRGVEHRNTSSSGVHCSALTFSDKPLQVVASVAKVEKRIVSQNVTWLRGDSLRQVHWVVKRPVNSSQESERRVWLSILVIPPCTGRDFRSVTRQLCSRLTGLQILYSEQTGLFKKSRKVFNVAL